MDTHRIATLRALYHGETDVRAEHVKECLDDIEALKEQRDAACEKLARLQGSPLLQRLKPFGGPAAREGGG